MMDLAKKEEVEMLRDEMSKMKKSSAEYIDKEECIERLNAINRKFIVETRDMIKREQMNNIEEAWEVKYMELDQKLAK